MNDDWQKHALCGKPGQDPDLWFPEDTDPRHLGGQEAKAICAQCPVKAQCLAWALATNQEIGIIGGMSPSERQHLAGRKRPPRICANSNCGQFFTAASAASQAQYCSAKCRCALRTTLYRAGTPVYA